MVAGDTTTVGFPGQGPLAEVRQRRCVVTYPPVHALLPHSPSIETAKRLPKSCAQRFCWRNESTKTT